MSKVIEPTFVVRGRNADDIVGYIYVSINFTLSKGNTRQVRFSMKDLTTRKPYKVSIRQWDKSSQNCIVRGNQQEKEYLLEINNQITEIRVAVSQIVQSCAAAHTSISTAVLSEKNIYSKLKHIENFIDAPEVDKSNLLVPYWEKFVIAAKEERVFHNGKPYDSGTIRGINKCLNAFKSFEKETAHKYTFEEIDKTFYDSYIAFLKENGKSINTLGEHIAKIKAIMQRSYDEKLHRNDSYKSFEKPGEEVDNVYLTEEELDKIFNVSLEGDKKYLDKYRDVFLVGCYTGLRWSDYSTIRKECLQYSPKSNPVLVVRTEKTDTRVVVPFLWKNLESILEKYDYSLPAVSLQNFNQYVKDVCMEAGVDDLVLMTSGKHKSDEPIPKYKLVSSHTARRSACTNMYLRGIPSISIMKISGHTTEANFLKYIKVSLEENADFIVENYK